MTKKPGKFQEEETPIDEEIASALAELMPEEWEEIGLLLKRLPFDPSGLAHSIQKPAGALAQVEPTDEIYAATHKLEKLFERHQKRFKSARYVLRRTGDGFDYEVSFEY